MITRTLPNILTLLRIILIPVFILFFYLPFEGHYWSSTGIFIVAALTDALDGFLARKLKQSSRFGEFLDPVADKLMISAALLLCTSKFASPWFTIPAIAIICREIVISALREWMAQVGQSTKVSVNIIGKIKTVIQMVAICFFISQPTELTSTLILGYLLLYTAFPLTIWSMCVYLKITIKQAHQEQKQEQKQENQENQEK